jgi:hypothetical protein
VAPGRDGAVLPGPLGVAAPLGTGSAGTIVRSGPSPWNDCFGRQSGVAAAPEVQAASSDTAAAPSASRIRADRDMRSSVPAARDRPPGAASLGR